MGKGSLCIQQLKGSNEELSGKQQRYRVEDNITVLAFNHVRSLASWQLKTRRQCVYYNVIGAVVHCGLVHCATHGTLSKRLVDLGGLSWALSEGAVVPLIIFVPRFYADLELMTLLPPLFIGSHECSDLE